MIIDWWIKSIKLKVLERSKIILEGIDVKFGVGGINALARPKETFIDIIADINNCYYWLFIKLVFTLINDISY